MHRIMKPSGKSANVSKPSQRSGPGGGVLFRGRRILFSACLVVIGLAASLLLIIAGLGDRSPAAAIFGLLVLGLCLGLGMMVFVRLRKRPESESISTEASFETKNSQDTCPLCGVAMTFNPRYPRAVCIVCASRASDAKGQALDFFNADFGGGFVAVYRDGGERYDSHECFVDGRACRADEARFGGIVVELSEESIRPTGHFTQE